MDRRVVMVVKDYTKDIETPSRFMKKERIQRLSCSIWAADELLNYIQKHDEQSPVDSTEEFIHKMKYYELANPKTSFMFSIAYETARNILDTFRAMEIE